MRRAVVLGVDSSTQSTKVLAVDVETGDPVGEGDQGLAGLQAEGLQRIGEVVHGAERRTAVEAQGADVADDQREGTHSRAVPTPEVVEDDRVVARVGEVACRQGADVAGAPRDQDAHREEGRDA